MKQLNEQTTIPPWVANSSAATSYGVVRRAQITNELVPIGLRGNARHERYGTTIHKKYILEIIKPYSLIEQLDNFKDNRFYTLLNSIRHKFDPYKIKWGPTGSVGFELATGIPVTSKKSDLDLIICMDAIDEVLLDKISNLLADSRIMIDPQIEIPRIGAFLLKDYMENKENGFILRTFYGPKLYKIL
ncbi:malonate decarboxylase holo-ACP synthase [Lysinibacillus agricola]|uniref:Malonate decarboxylase holo-ACP synthase n=1 Tax=Lysinibacillus agricola TaxID=2590012 RepID=A0ABX7AWL9_9BACI|nr:malonate decarboxylase holo-ACP synthase [Lysinibacillus agricola]